MVCCTLFAMLLAAPAWLFTRLRAKPLAWRPLTATDVVQPQIRQRFSWTARLKSFAYAGQGLEFLIVREHNARIHLAASLAVIVIGLALRISLSDWRWICAAIAWVWAAEALNTAIEQICNLVSPGPNEHVRIAKDVAAAAVLVSAISAGAIGTLTFWPYLRIELWLTGNACS